MSASNRPRGPATCVAAQCAVCVRSACCLLSRLDGPEVPVVEYGVQADEIVSRRTESVQRLLTIKVGLLVVRRQGPSGPARAVAIVGPGQTLGFDTLLQPGPSMFEVAALSEARLCARPMPASAASAIPTGDVLAESTRFAEMLADWAVIARLPTALQRVEAALQRLATAIPSTRLILPDRNVFAELVACAPETVSRALATLVKEGRVRRGER